jgi:hypothetical protein
LIPLLVFTGFWVCVLGVQGLVVVKDLGQLNSCSKFEGPTWINFANYKGEI